MNVPAIFALKKMHRWSGRGTFARVLKFHFAAATRTGLVIGMARLQVCTPVWK